MPGLYRPDLKTTFLTFYDLDGSSIQGGNSRINSAIHLNTPRIQPPIRAKTAGTNNIYKEKTSNFIDFKVNYEYPIDCTSNMADIKSSNNKVLDDLKAIYTRRNIKYAKLILN